MGDVDLHIREFGKHAVIELVSPKQIDAAGLLSHVIGDRHKGDLAFEINTAVDHGHDAADQRTEAGLHIHYAVPKEPPVFDRAVERIALPAFAHRLGVEMSGEEETGAGLAAVDFPEGVKPALVGFLAPDFADLERLEARFQIARQCVLLAVGAVDAHHLLGETDRRFGRSRGTDPIQRLYVHCFSPIGPVTQLSE